MDRKAYSIRSYGQQDFVACCNIFKSNVPKFFDASELNDFQFFLKNLSHENFWIIDVEDKVIGSGGFRFIDSKTARLSYGMVHSDMHGEGWGKILLEYRIDQISKNSDIEKIEVNTSQHVASFFEKYGFEIYKRNYDHYGDGIDQCRMRLNLL